MTVMMEDRVRLYPCSLLVNNAPKDCPILCLRKHRFNGVNVHTKLEKRSGQMSKKSENEENEKVRKVSLV